MNLQCTEQVQLALNDDTKATIHGTMNLQCTEQVQQTYCGP